MSHANAAGVLVDARAHVSHPPGQIHLFVRFYRLCCEIVHIERNAKTNKTPPTVPTLTPSVSTSD